jgi:hypothetical protein
MSPFLSYDDHDDDGGGGGGSRQASGNLPSVDGSQSSYLLFLCFILHFPLSRR